MFDWEDANFTKAEVKKLIQESFTGFANVKAESLRVVAEFLINEYNFTKLEVKALMQKSFTGVARAKLESLRFVAEFLINEYNFTKLEVKALMQESFQGFTLAKPESLRSVAEFLLSGKIRINGQWQQMFDWEGANFEKVEVKALMQESFKGFASTKPESLLNVIEFLINEYNFEKVEVKALMQRSFQGFASAEPKSLLAVAGFLINGKIRTNGQWQQVFDWEDANFTKAKVKVLMQESFKGFALAKPENLRSMAEFLINEYNFTKPEVKALMQESFQGFARAKPENLRPVAEFLINGKVKVKGQWQQVFDWEGTNFTKSEVKALMQESFFSFTRVKPESLQSMAELLINGKVKIKGQWQQVFSWEDASFTKSEVKTLMQESFEGFTRVEPEGFQGVIEFLINGKIKASGQWQQVFDWEDAKFTKHEIKALIQENSTSFINAKPKNLLSVAELLINKYNFEKVEIKALMQKNFQRFASAMPENLLVVAEFLINGKIKVSGQWRQVFDWKDASFTKAEVKALMQESFMGFANATPENLLVITELLINGKIKVDGQWQQVFDWENENFTNAEVKALIQENLSSFARVKSKNLQFVAKFLIKEYNFTNAELKELIQKSFQGFASATPENLQSMTEFLTKKYDFTNAELKELMQKSIKGFARANLKILERIAESSINIYMEKGVVKKKIQHNINKFLNINFNELSSLINSIQQMMNLLSITQKQQWEARLKQVLLDHLLKEDLIERLQKLKNEMTSLRDGACPAAVLP